MVGPPSSLVSFLFKFLGLVVHLFIFISGFLGVTPGQYSGQPKMTWIFLNAFYEYLLLFVRGIYVRKYAFQLQAFYKTGLALTPYSYRSQDPPEVNN